MKTTAELRRLAHLADTRRTRARIAVLPFDDLTPDGPAASVADTLMALVISNLAARDGISVVSRRSSLRYRDARAALADIARDLDASRIVEGCVLRLGEQLHVIFHLVDPGTGVPMVARSYTGQWRTIERVQAAIAWQVAAELAAAAND